MTSVSEVYESKFSNRPYVALIMLGGDPKCILADWQNKLDNPEEMDPSLNEIPLFRDVPPLTAETAAQYAHWQIIRELERLFFTRLPRETAVAVCNSLYLIDDSRFIISPGAEELVYNSYAFKSAWNKHNPDQPEIILSGIDIG